jgi:hypothetical protein
MAGQLSARNLAIHSPWRSAAQAIFSSQIDPTAPFDGCSLLAYQAPRAMEQINKTLVSGNCSTNHSSNEGI